MSFDAKVFIVKTSLLIKKHSPNQIRVPTTISK